MSGAQIPLAQLAALRIVEGPAMIRDENGRLAGYVYVDVDTARRDLGSFVDDAKRAVASQLRMPAGYTLQWSGQYEAMERVRQRMLVVVPLTLFVGAFFGLVPIMWSTGAGADVMQRIAAPMIGGLFTSFLMELLVYPAIYYRWKWRAEVRHYEGGFDETFPAGDPDRDRVLQTVAA